jgi:hypothetical protein
MDQENKGQMFKGNYHDFRKHGHNSAECKLLKKDNSYGNRNKLRPIILRELEIGNTVITAAVVCILKRSASEIPGIPTIEFKPKCGNKEVRNVEIL